MNAIVEFPRGKLTKVNDPELEALALKAQIAALKRQVRALKKALKDERAHSVDMLAIMRSFNTPRMRTLLRTCECDTCTCTPTRAEMLSRR